MKLLYLFILLLFISCTNSTTNTLADDEKFTPTFTFSQEYKVYGKNR